MRSPNPASRPSIPNDANRAAASSMASAIPSRFRHTAAIRRTSTEFNALPPAAARPRNSSTASPGPPSSDSTDNPGTENTHSKGTNNRALLVASTTTCGLPASSRSSRTTTPSSRCSQLSRTSSACRSASQSRTLSVGERAWFSPRPRTSAIVGAIIAESVTGTRSTYQTPSMNWPATSAATLKARRVFPTPPGPTAVTRRCSWSAAVSVARSARRPTNGVNADGNTAAAVGIVTPLRTGDEAWRDAGERAAILGLQLAQQRGNVTLDGTRRDEQSGRRSRRWSDARRVPRAPRPHGPRWSRQTLDSRTSASRVRTSVTQAAISARRPAPSLTRMCSTWVAAVLAVTCNAAPISRFVRPAVMS